MVFYEYPSSGKQLLGRGNDTTSLPFLVKEVELAKNEQTGLTFFITFIIYEYNLQYLR
jgi:hypothetical protein